MASQWLRLQDQEELQGRSWTLVLGFASGNTEPGLGIVMSQSFSFQHLIKHHLFREAFPITLLKLGIPCSSSITVQCVCACVCACVRVCVCMCVPFTAFVTICNIALGPSPIGSLMCP